MIQRENNDKLCDFARFFRLDGDWLTCTKCKRSLIASRDGEPMSHATGCKHADRQHPWAELRALIAPAHSAPEAPAPAEYTGVRCTCVDTNCRPPLRGPGCPHYSEHCRKHIAHTRGVAVPDPHTFSRKTP